MTELGSDRLLLIQRVHVQCSSLTIYPQSIILVHAYVITDLISNNTIYM